jgi:hypothetical protein
MPEYIQNNTIEDVGLSSKTAIYSVVLRCFARIIEIFKIGLVLAIQTLSLSLH